MDMVEKPTISDNASGLSLLRWHRRARITLAPIGALVLIVAINAVGGCSSGQRSAPPARSFPSAPTSSARPLTLATGFPLQVELPFTGLRWPKGVAVDSAGNVYVADYLTDRVLKLPAGSNTAVELPFTGLVGPNGVAVDSAGNVYVADSFLDGLTHFTDRVLELPAGSNTAVELPFTGLYVLAAVAVDRKGDVYVADNGNRVLKLPARSNTQTEVRFTGLGDPTLLGVDSVGDVYVADGNRVLELRTGWTAAQVELRVTGLKKPVAVAVDSVGNVYIVDDHTNQVLKLLAGSTGPAEPAHTQPPRTLSRNEGSRGQTGSRPGCGVLGSSIASSNRPC
jgi:DNA-binding beta-propeller fold protein YncE